MRDLSFRFARSIDLFVVIAVLLALGGVARAGDPKFEYQDAPAKEETKPWVLKANASVGLVWATGNSQSIGFSGNGLFSAKHYANQWTLFGQTAYVNSGISKFGMGGPITSTATSTAMWLLKARYDRYFLQRNTVFVAFQSSGDKPAGYVYRLEPQAGYSRIFFVSARQAFKGEFGYDYTFEHRPFSGPGPVYNVDFHCLRAYLFYENKFTHYASFSEGVEGLWAVNDIQSVRVNSLTSLSSTISKNVSLKLNLTVKFNNLPPPRPAPTGIDPATMMPFVLPADQITFDKVDTLLEAVVAVTFL